MQIIADSFEITKEMALKAHLLRLAYFDSQVALGRAAGTTNATISNIERMGTARIGRDIISRVASALNVDLRDLVESRVSALDILRRKGITIDRHMIKELAEARPHFRLDELISSDVVSDDIRNLSDHEKAKLVHTDESSDTPALQIHLGEIVQISELLNEALNPKVQYDPGSPESMVHEAYKTSQVAVRKALELVERRLP